MHTNTHLGARNVLFRVLEVHKESVFAPRDALVDVGLRVRESRGLAGLATEEAVQVRTLLVCLASDHGVALSAFGLEDLGSLVGAHCFCD